MKQVFLLMALFLSFIAQSQVLYVPGSKSDSVRLVANINGAPRNVYAADILKDVKLAIANTQTFDPATKQDILTSGINIKTINNQPITGSGNINIITDTAQNIRIRAERPVTTDNFWISSIDARLHWRVNGWEYIHRASTIDSIADYTPQNLLKATEQMETGFWDYGVFTFGVNNVVAPDGTTTAETITTASQYQPFPQAATVVPGHTYTFSAYYKKGTMTSFNGLAVTDLSHGNATVASSRLLSSESTTTGWTRLSVTFTAVAGMTTAYCYILQTNDITGTVFVWGAQLNEGPIRPYTKVVDSAIVP